MSIRAERTPSKPVTPQAAPEPTAEDAPRAAVGRREAIAAPGTRTPAAGVALPVDHYNATRDTNQTGPLNAADLLEIRDQIRQRRQARSSGGPLIGESQAFSAGSATATAPPKPVPTSSFDDDPFAQPSLVEQVPLDRFTLDGAGRPVGLEGPRVRMVETDSVGQFNQQGDVVPFATNPWSLPKPGANGDFVYPNEARFPAHQVQLDAQGRPAVNAEGLQIWSPRDLHVGQSTAFEAINEVLSASETWAGRPVKWGQDGQLAVNTHEFIDLNAFYNPLDGALHLGVVPYRTQGSNEVKMFEMASSAEVTGHEAGHAVHDELKPNKGLVDLGYRQWGESFADQLSMWSSLRDPERRAEILQQTGGDLSKPSSMTRLAEAFGALTGQGDSLRDALNNLKVSTTSSQFHERSQVLTGAGYKIFQGVFADLKKRGLSDDEALRQGGDIMGTFQMRATEHTPENSMTLADVGKAYLKVDKEYFGGRFQKLITDELISREIFNRSSLAEWRAHEANLPQLSLSTDPPSREKAEKLVRENLDKLAPNSRFGLQVQDFHVDSLGQQVVRVQVMDGRGPNAKPLENHGVMTFRKDGTLMDYQKPLPQGLTPQRANDLLTQATEAGLDRRGPVALVPRADGGFTAQVVEEVRTKQDPHLTVYSLEQPVGTRREYYFKEQIRERAEHCRFKNLLPDGAQRLSPQELLSMSPS